MSVFPLLTTVDDKLSREINIAPIDFFRDIANVSEITTANIMRRIICEARSSFNVWSSYRIYCDMYLKSEIDSEKKAILEDVIIDYWLRV
jgi:predicted DNA-binding ribbon-helix-helix protein